MLVDLCTTLLNINFKSFFRLSWPYSGIIGCIFHWQKPVVASWSAPKDFSISQWSILRWQRNKYCSDWTLHICQCTGIKSEGKTVPPSEQTNRALCFSFWSLCWHSPHFWDYVTSHLTNCWLGKPTDSSCSWDISPNCSKEMKYDLLLKQKQPQIGVE